MNPTITAMAHSLNQWLSVEKFNDYCPNGLQIAAYPHDRRVQKLGYAVTASLAVVESARAWGADALLVHHGYFWKNEERALIGSAYSRLRAFIDSGMALLAYHLPLDAHPQWGNNAVLARALNIELDGTFGEQNLGVCGRWAATEPTLAVLIKTITAHTGRSPSFVSHPPDKTINRIGLCTGGAQSYFHSAINAGVDIFITGEASEWVYHIARESGVAYIAAGHDATERGGVSALAQAIHDEWGCEIKCFFEDNPI